jgi:type I restriction enzyme S subunit
MSEWKKVKLGDIASAIQTGPFGSQLHQSDYSDVGTPVVMPKDIVCGKIDVSAIARVESHHVERLSRHKINEGDILYARRGDVGKCAYTDKSQTGWLCGTGCLRVTVDKAKAMPEFVFFQLQKKDTVGWVEKHAIGATMLNLNTSILSNVPIELPSLSTQHSIATILSRYDSLIENYQKQIKLLEEAAQRLYKEWFVDLHFPGHENTKIVDGVPEGWEKKTIGDIVVFYDKQRKPLSSVQRMHMEKIYPYYGAAALMDYVDSYLFDGIYLLLGEDGTVITPDNFPVLQYVWGKFWVNNHAHVLRGKDGISIEFLYSMFKEMPIADVVTGAAQPKISQGRLSDKKILMPYLGLIQEWSGIAKHYFGRIRVITEQIRLLTEARDRLLPKLMSGEITV